MHVQYEPVIDEVSDEQSDEGDIFFITTSRLERRRWPVILGTVLIVDGIITSLLGTLEVVVLPIIESDDNWGDINFNRSNCWGAGIIAGIVMVLAGSTAIRASVSKRRTTIYRFYNLSAFTLLLDLAVSVLLIVAYGKGWTTKNNYPPDSAIHQVHMFVTIFTVLGTMFALTTVVQYYQVVCFGHVRLWDWWKSCLCGLCMTMDQSQPKLRRSLQSNGSTVPAMLI
ncbi:hypothetical protein C0Q70_07563 [Pomacea canaliculata]|uniref:Uncharacterized protein n=1 Tax=Pomacea canaliculata TaxID=400727 RepID=A0A2T7PFD6_POMCA|nr:uncharacterized protein LOC112561099 [Pomacea canaliculata]XP_025089116.1 uncharacterized protein LOC112561099 [Pomacea canaliculata]PVD32135.1 hypothetical protein C0Q70_07563 [Pomacea canaliculata]